jgi:hypothetical protein
MGRSHERQGSRRLRVPLITLGVIAVATIGVVALLVNIFGRRQEARVPFVRLVEVDEQTTDPAPWGIDSPSHTVATRGKRSAVLENARFWCRSASAK